MYIEVFIHLSKHISNKIFIESLIIINMFKKFLIIKFV